MTKLGFVSPGSVKSSSVDRLWAGTLSVFCDYSPSANILTNGALSFVPSVDVHDRLKKLSLKGLFNMNFNGVALNIELTHSYKGICDAIYH